MFHVIPVNHEIPGVNQEISGVSPNIAGKAHQHNNAGVPGCDNNKDNNNNKPITIEAPQRDGVLRPGLADLEQTALTQHLAKKGLQIFGKDEEEAIVSEMKQLDSMDAVEPMNANMMTTQEKKDALECLMFLKKKRCGRIKGRGCADGRKQRTCETKEETSSPMVATEALFTSCVMDADERREVATCDIPGASTQASMDKVVHVRLSGPLATLLTRVDPKKCSKCIVKEKGKPVLHVKLKKALCGTLQAASLFWRDLSSQLKKWGFTANPHDECVANKMINGKQCAIPWHVDDLKMSHVEKGVVDEMISKLNNRYGKEAPLTATRGLIHDYLGMVIDHSTPGKVTMRMDECADAIIAEARPDMEGASASLAAEHLFDVNKTNPVKLENDDSQCFHTMTAKLLFLSKRARPDLQQAVAFLTTRVKAPDQDNCKKLAQVIKCLRNEPHLALTLEADNMQVVKWWVDASFAVHKDMRSHAGGTMSLGKGSVYSTSTRQKLNTTSSTEAELVGVNDLMTMTLWTQCFLKAQGHTINKSVICQDNKSAILLEKNGRASSGRRTRHVNIRHFFIADMVKSGDVSIEHCPTEEMRADYLTKPLQGTKFRRFRNEMLNMQDDNDDGPAESNAAASPQECVGTGN